MSFHVLRLMSCVLCPLSRVLCPLPRVLGMSFALRYEGLHTKKDMEGHEKGHGRTWKDTEGQGMGQGHSSDSG
jgi:hypothetical protein